MFLLIHFDIWGRYSTPSHTGAHYFLTIVDDCSCCTWIYLMKHKSEIFKYLTFFCKMVQTKFRSLVRQVRSDNGREFFSNQTQDFFRSNGMEHQTSCVDTPQQNGVVERKQRHLLEVARALRFQAHLPLLFGVSVF